MKGSPCGTGPMWSSSTQHYMQIDTHVSSQQGCRGYSNCRRRKGGGGGAIFVSSNRELQTSISTLKMTCRICFIQLGRGTRFIQWGQWGKDQPWGMVWLPISSKGDGLRQHGGCEHPFYPMGGGGWYMAPHFTHRRL